MLGSLVTEIEKALGCRVFPAVIKDRRGPQGLNFESPARTACVIARSVVAVESYADGEPEGSVVCAKVAVQGRALLHGRWAQFGSWAKRHMTFE